VYKWIIQSASRARAKDPGFRVVTMKVELRREIEEWFSRRGKKMHKFRTESCSSMRNSGTKNSKNL
jgi:methylase of polypeptide subunit release factors